MLWSVMAGPLRADQAGDFRYSSSGGVVTITAYTGTAQVVNIPAAIAGVPVRVIGYRAFGFKNTITALRAC